MFLTWWPWPLTYGIDIQTWPRYTFTWLPCQNPSLYVCPLSCESKKDRQTARQTDRQTVGVILLHLRRTYLFLFPLLFANCLICRVVPVFWSGVWDLYGSIVLDLEVLKVSLHLLQLKKYHKAIQYNTIQCLCILRYKRKVLHYYITLIIVLVCIIWSWKR